MEKRCNDSVIKQYELLKEMLINYHNAIIDIFGEYELCISENGVIFIKSESGKKFVYIPDSLENNSICFSTRDDFTYDGFYFSFAEHGILVNEIKVDLHRKGANVEFIQRLYGKSRYDENKKALLDLQSTNYVVKNYSSFGNLMDIDFLEGNSILTTIFSAHMKFFYKVEGEIRSYVSTIYPAHVYFNGEDISQVYEFVDGIDKISRIYNLYSGNVKKEAADIKTINLGLADESSFDYKNKHIGSQIEELIGELRDIDIQLEMEENLIEKRTGKPRPVVIGLRDATRVEYGITPTQSRNRLDDKIDDIIDTKISSKVKRFVRKLVSPRNQGNK